MSFPTVSDHLSCNFPPNLLQITSVVKPTTLIQKTKFKWTSQIVFQVRYSPVCPCRGTTLSDPLRSGLVCDSLWPIKSEGKKGRGFKSHRLVLHCYMRPQNGSFPGTICSWHLGMKTTWGRAERH